MFEPACLPSATGFGKLVEAGHSAGIAIPIKICSDRPPMENNAPQPTPHPPWIVYIVRCRGRSYYTGITTDLTRRIAEHNSAGGGAKYTRPRRPVTLVYSEAAPSRATAAQREHQIKQMSLAAKIELIGGGQSADLNRTGAS